MKLLSAVLPTIALGLAQLSAPSQPQDLNRFEGVATEALLENPDGSRTGESLLFTFDKWTGAISVCALSSRPHCRGSSPLLPRETRARFSVVQPPSIGSPNKLSAVVFLLDTATGQRWQVFTDSKDGYGTPTLQIRSVSP